MTDSESISKQFPAKLYNCCSLFAQLESQKAPSSFLIYSAPNPSLINNFTICYKKLETNQ